MVVSSPCRPLPSSLGRENFILSTNALGGCASTSVLGCAAKLAPCALSGAASSAALMKGSSNDWTALSNYFF